jgi:hypothetical protein
LDQLDARLALDGQGLIAHVLEFERGLDGHVERHFAKVNCRAVYAQSGAACVAGRRGGWGGRLPRQARKPTATTKTAPTAMTTKGQGDFAARSFLRLGRVPLMRFIVLSAFDQ